MNVMMEHIKFCNKLFLVCGAEEHILADATANGPHKSEQEKSAIWSKVLFLMETPLRIFIGIQSLQNNLLSPQERWLFWKIFYKISWAVGTRSSFLVRWFVSLTLLRICCTLNSTNMKVSMDRSLPHIRTVLLIGVFTCCIKKIHDLEKNSRRAWAWLTYSRHKCHFW